MPSIPQMLLLTALGLCFLAHVSWSCDEAMCASLVSKCLLLKSCECNMIDKANCTCCKDCQRCLSNLYLKCCDCVGMCPAKSHNMYKDSLEQASSIEDLQEPMPALFSALTDEEDPDQRWSIYTYPAHLDLLYFKPRGPKGTLDLNPNSGTHEGHRIRHGEHHITIDPDTKSMNCTVAYHAQCMALPKCKESCQSMGAARYRWFHQYGCCECIGSTCLNFGKGEALCLKCPHTEDEDKETELGYYYNEYYTEDTDFYNEDVYEENIYAEEDTNEEPEDIAQNKYKEVIEEEKGEFGQRHGILGGAGMGVNEETDIY